jgi:hypothetical protein
MEYGCRPLSKDNLFSASEIHKDLAHDSRPALLAQPPEPKQAQPQRQLIAVVMSNRLLTIDSQSAKAGIFSSFRLVNLSALIS